VLLCGFAALSAADRVIPSMTLRPLLLAAAALAGVVWGIVMQYALRRLLTRGRRGAVVLLLLCVAALIAAVKLTGARGALLAALLATVAVWLLLIFGPKRRQSGVDTLSDLLGWRRYLRSMTPTLAQQLLEADSQYYYRTLLFAEALGVGGSFSRAFEGQKMVVCSFFERDGKPAPRTPGKFRELLLDTLAAARGEARRQSAKKKSPKRRPERRERPTQEQTAPVEKAADRVRNNNPRRRPVEVYDPEDDY
jgi:Ca2+/Na+ antiporter